MYSLIETAKANGLNVERYMLHNLTVLPVQLSRDLRAVVDDLLPLVNSFSSELVCHRRNNNSRSNIEK